MKTEKEDQERLLLKAPSAGTILPPPLTPHRDDPDERLSTWSGTPLEPENIGAQLEQGTLFCQIGDPTKLEAVMVIDQADRNLILDGKTQVVDSRSRAFASSETIRTHIAKVGESPLKVAPKRLSNKSQGELPTETDPQTGVERPMSTSYQAERSDRRSERSVSDRSARPGPRADEVDFARRPLLATGDAHVQFQAQPIMPSPPFRLMSDLATAEWGIGAMRHIELSGSANRNGYAKSTVDRLRFYLLLISLRARRLFSASGYTAATERIRRRFGR